MRCKPSKSEPLTGARLMSPLKDLRLVLLPTKEVHHYQCFGGVCCQAIGRLSMHSPETHIFDNSTGEVMIVWARTPFPFV